MDDDTLHVHQVWQRSYLERHRLYHILMKLCPPLVLVKIYMDDDASLAFHIAGLKASISGWKMQKTCSIYIGWDKSWGN